MPEADSPPRPEMDDEEDFDEEEMIYVGDADEVIEELEAENDYEMMDEDAVAIDDAITVFSKHEKSVFCGSLTNDGKIAVTGGEDDVAYLWDTLSGEIIHKCTGHEDSVFFAEFNHDFTYLATGDMKGIIKVWRMRDKAIIWDYNIGDASWMRWHNLANVLFAGSVEGEIYMWKIPSGECKVFQGYGQKSEAATVITDGKKLIAGYEDGTIRVLDLKEGTVQVTISAAHSESITSLDCQSDGKLIASAALDGKTVLSTVQTGKIVAILQNLQENKSNNSDTNAEESNDELENKNYTEAVAFCKDPELHMVVSGTIRGEIFIWDTVKQAIRHKIVQEGGVSKLIWKGITPFICSAGLDGVLRCYDARTAECCKTCCGHSNYILDVSISKNSEKILTTSDDSTARIFDISDCQ
ncbi:hypothetical protein PV328_010073 [Microctonus aethiopoides]|uniref:Angio-associated migratory cell protein n=1 Tax=Microctonus aethiopoides TaxID=144406 RepID=A0AA39EXB8_9HYME|nr:hypothetical protein PV328_010073 [Microctonus aethiopoides]